MPPLNFGCLPGYLETWDNRCVKCDDEGYYWDAEERDCLRDVIYGRISPPYSYVYNYTNKTEGNITYPEYEIITTVWNESDTYVEGEGNVCPCDMSDTEMSLQSGT